MSKAFGLLLPVVVALCNIHCICGQETYYYKLTKKIQDGIEYTNTAGGQFITFSGDQCYDSDKYGVSVGNGQLTYTEQYSGNTRTYEGRSYFGYVLYRFKTDLSVLNIIVNNSLMYVYKRQAPPSSVTTCLLIRKKVNNGSTTTGGYVPMYPAYPANGGYPNGGATIDSNTGQNSSSFQQQPTKQPCSLCHGQGRIVKDTYPALYGTEDYQVRCNECGGYFMRSTGHTHITCPQCHGRGYTITD